MSTAEKVTIYVVLAVLAIAVALLALTVHRAATSTADRATVVVHAETLRVHGDRINSVWRAQDRINARLAALEHGADRARDGR